MEIWILTLLALRPKFGSMAQMYEKRAEREALNMTDDAYTVFERLSLTNDVKRRVVNASVLCERAVCALGDDVRYLEQYLTRSAADIAESEGCSRIKIYRLLKRLLCAAAKKLYALGYDEDKMRRDYNDVPLFAKTYARIKRAKSKERKMPPSKISFVTAPNAAVASV